jgi:hypothetical protein
MENTAIIKTEKYDIHFIIDSKFLEDDQYIEYCGLEEKNTFELLFSDTFTKDQILEFLENGITQ